MSNRQARREQMRTSRQQTAQQRPSRPTAPGPRKTGGGGGGSGLPRFLSQPFLLMVIALVIALAVILTLVVMLQGTNTGGLPEKLITAEQTFPYDLAKGTKLGKDDAPLKMVEYEDFQCPFCLLYTANQEPTLIEEYVKTGKLQIEYKHLPNLGTESVRAGRASQCVAAQDKFWQFHHKLFLTQAEAGQSTNEKVNAGRFSDGNLRKYAVEAGADGAKFDECFTAQESLSKVQADQQEAGAFGIGGTPGFTINGRPIGSGAPSSLDGWRQLLNQLLEAANATPSATASTTAAASATATTPTATTPAATATPAAATPTATP